MHQRCNCAPSIAFSRSSFLNETELKHSSGIKSAVPASHLLLDYGWGRGSLIAKTAVGSDCVLASIPWREIKSTREGEGALRQTDRQRQTDRREGSQRALA